MDWENMIKYKNKKKSKLRTRVEFPKEFLYINSYIYIPVLHKRISLRVRSLFIF